MASSPSRLAAPASLALHAALYVVIGWMSFSTAYLQPNAATIWLPSGFALGLLLAKGPGFWPSVTLGSFILNSIASPSLSAAAIFAAGAIAFGNTAEALLGAYLTRRFANGAGFPYRTRSVTRFMLLVVPVPPLVSTAIGVSASVWSGIPMTGTIGDVALTWYIANAQGILLFGGLTVLLLSQNAGPLKAPSVVEGVVLTLALAFAVQVMTGAFKVDWLQNWPRAYMLIPLVLWASFRFGTLGGLFAVAFITLGSAIGTMQGQFVFNAETPWQSLIYLQVYLAMLATIALAVGAALAELDESRSELENRVASRTRAVEHLLEHRHISTTLAAHDLKSPIFGVRNALLATRQAVIEGNIGKQDLAEGLEAMEDACSTLLDRIVGILPKPEAGTGNAPPSSLDIQDIFERSRAAHRPAMRARNVKLELDLPEGTRVALDREAEHIVNTLIDNALRHAPDGSAVKVGVQKAGGFIAISVVNDGPPLRDEDLARLFQRQMPGEAPPRTNGEPRSGMGLYLAARQAQWLGGSLSYTSAQPRGVCFTLSIPDTHGS